MLMWNT